jgi:hypothetical protein
MSQLNPYGIANLKQATKDMEAAAAKNAEFAPALPEFDPKHIVGLEVARVAVVNPVDVAGLGVRSSYDRGVPFGSALPPGTLVTRLRTTPAGVLVDNLQRAKRTLIPWQNIAAVDLLP